jgi:hypothetical protein
VKKVLKIVRKFLFALAPDCRQSVRLQSRSMDANLSWSEYVGLKFHLVLCSWCRRYASQLGFLRGATHAAEEKPSAKLPADARERINRSLKDAA